MEWFWTDIHDRAVSQVKSFVTPAPVLKYFDSTKGVTLRCDASDKGLGAVIMQNDCQPTAYASCALTDAETRYAQIEKELLAFVYGLETFHTYMYGRSVAVQSDHKPLEMIFKKSLHKAPNRLQRMLMRTQLIIDFHNLFKCTFQLQFGFCLLSIRNKMLLFVSKLFLL